MATAYQVRISPLIFYQNLSVIFFVVQSIGSWDECIAAWTQALNSLPKENLSEAETKQKRQYDEGLKLAQQCKGYLLNAPTPTPPTGKDLGDMPWERAQLLVNELQDQGSAGARSSVSLVLFFGFYSFKLMARMSGMGYS